MKRYDYNKTVEACHWNNEESALRECLKNTSDLYAVTANGWWFCFNIMFIGHSFQECLDYIECTPEEYEKQKNSPKNTEGFWNYEIIKIDLEDLLNTVIKDRIYSAKCQWNKEQTEEVINDKAMWIAKHTIENFLDNFNSRLAEKLTFDVKELLSDEKK